MSKTNWIPFAKIGRPKGLKGEVFSDTFNADSELFDVMSEAGIGHVETNDVAFKKRITDSYFNGKRWVIKFEGIDTVEAAQGLTNMTVFAQRDDFLPLQEGQYYHIDLVGLNVQDEQGRDLGRVTHVYSVAHNDVLEFEKDGKLYTCALIKDFLLKVSLEEKLIVCKRDGVIDAL